MTADYEPHDPLCRAGQGMAVLCECPLIARVAEREQERMEGVVRADEAEFWAKKLRKRREVLADLRAKVEGLHRAVIDGEPHICRGEVLALIEEADRG